MNAGKQANQAHAYALKVNTPEAWLVASDAAEEAGDGRSALVYRFFATVAPRPIHSGVEIVHGLRRLGATELYPTGVTVLPSELSPLTARIVRGMKRRRLYGLFQALATYFVGDEKTELYFLSNRGGIFAIFWDREEAIDRARYRDLYVEGPGGEEWHASWA